MWKLWVRTVAACVAVAVIGTSCTRTTDEPVERGPNAVEWSPEWWRDILGGDDDWDDARLADLADQTRSGLDTTTYDAAVTTAAAALERDLTAATRDPLRDRWWHQTTTPGAVLCDTFHVAGTGAAAIPAEVAPTGPTGATTTGTWVKVAVVWRGDCPVFDTTADDPYPQVTFVLVWGQGAALVAVRDWFAPGVDPTEGERIGGMDPWALAPLRCAGDGHQARVEVAAAWNQMCDDAAAAGVALDVVSSYRTPTDQARLVTAAEDSYGADNAGRYVAGTDNPDDCASRHCAGSAIDVADRNASNVWLSAAVACPDGVLDTPAERCPDGTAPSARLVAYGFATPLPTSTHHIEYVAPLTALDPAGACAPPSQMSVAEMVAAVFRCRLFAVGYTNDVVERAVADALVVSRCESGWNPNLASYAGRFSDDPNPIDDLNYDAAGVFPFDPATAAKWVPGGAVAVRDPLANIHGAASVWLAERSFATWGCANRIADQPPRWATMF